MLFIVRGKNRDHECALRVQADSAKEAESIGFKRGLFVTEVTETDDADGESGKLDRVAELVLRAWKGASADSLKCFGQTISTGQAAALIFCGLATWAIDLRTLVFHDTVPPLVRQLTAVAALLVSVAVAVLLHLRRSRDRARIRADLQTRRCRLICAWPKLGRLGFYDVEYSDAEDDAVEASCTIRPGTITWHDDDGLKPGVLAASANDLPTYGQNWRG